MSERVVVIGAGMVGHRFVDELVRADPAGRFAVELIGAEEYEPYNRILLSEVLAGRADLRALGLPLPDAGRVVCRGAEPSPPREKAGVAATRVVARRSAPGGPKDGGH